MKKIILIAIIYLFLFGSAVFAEEILPAPGTLPDSSFYFFKSWKESIQTFFTFGAENKARQYLHLAEVRLAEYQKMAEKGKTEIAQKTLEKYEKQLNRALEKAGEAKEKGGEAEKLKETISEKILKHQEVLERVLEKAPEQAWKGIENAIEASQKGFENTIQAVIGEKKETLQRRAEEIKGRTRGVFEALKEKLPPPTDKEIEKPEIETYEEESAEPSSEATPVSEETQKPAVCIQMITPAMDSYGRCKEFPTPCDVPEGWKKVDKCSAQIQIQPESTQTTLSASLKPLIKPDTSLPLKTGEPRIEFPSLYLTEPLTIMLSPGAPVPQPTIAGEKPALKPMADDEWCAKKRMIISEPTEQGRKTILEMLGVKTVQIGSVSCQACHIRKFSEDGILTSEQWDDFYHWFLQKLPIEWGCKKKVNYKNFIGGEWVDYPMLRERWSPQAYRYSCVKDDGKYMSGNVDICEKGVAVVAPAPVSTKSASDIGCAEVIIKEHVCFDGIPVKWQCQCQSAAVSSADYRYNCYLKPAEYCLESNISASLTVISINVRAQIGTKTPSIFWVTNQPSISYIEHGPTFSYGFKDSSTSNAPDTKFVVWNLTQDGISIEKKLQSGTVYHFRIIAEDINGSKFISQDYTFTVGL